MLKNDIIGASPPHHYFTSHNNNNSTIEKNSLLFNQHTALVPPGCTYFAHAHCLGLSFSSPQTHSLTSHLLSTTYFHTTFPTFRIVFPASLSLPLYTHTTFNTTTPLSGTSTCPSWQPIFTTCIRNSTCKPATGQPHARQLTVRVFFSSSLSSSHYSRTTFNITTPLYCASLCPVLGTDNCASTTLSATQRTVNRTHDYTPSDQYSHCHINFLLLWRLEIKRIASTQARSSSYSKATFPASTHIDIISPTISKVSVASPYRFPS